MPLLLFIYFCDKNIRTYLEEEQRDRSKTWKSQEDQCGPGKTPEKEGNLGGDGSSLQHPEEGWHLVVDV